MAASAGLMDVVRNTAGQYGLPRGLLPALIQQESGFDPGAVGAAGEVGLTQIMPDTAASPGFGVAAAGDLSDPNEQVRFGAEYLKAMLDRYGGDKNKALAAYNWGAGNVDKLGDDFRLSRLPESTQKYIQNITGTGAPKVNYDGPFAGIVQGLADKFYKNGMSKPEQTEQGLEQQFDRQAGLGSALFTIGQNIAAGG